MAVLRPPAPSGSAPPPGLLLHGHPTDRLPARFGKFTLIRKLGAGGMAELFLALQRSAVGFEKLVVIKRILPHLNADRALVHMLLHEAKIAATLSHPNVVQTFDAGSIDGVYYIAMEHVHGEDLRSIVRQMKKRSVSELPLEHALSIILGVSAGLAYVHERRDLDGSALRIVHRDISPQNVVVSFTGHVKVVDFGIAKSEMRMVDDTHSGRLKGKIPYMSPEQARGEEVDLRSDVFATGVMLFELTTGKRLFKGASEFETLKLICDGDYPRPTQVRDGYPRDLEDIVMCALERDREKRWQSAGEMQAALEGFVRRERLPVSAIALARFVGSLFEDELASESHAFRQGRQLADGVGVAIGEGTEGPVDVARRPSTFPPAASPTLTDLRVHRGNRVGVALGTLALVAAAVAIGATTPWARLRRGGSVEPARAVVQVAKTRGSLAIASEPPGASIFVNGIKSDEVTPTTLKLPTGASYIVALAKEGFEEASRTTTLTEEDPSGALSVVLARTAAPPSEDGGVTPPVRRHHSTRKKAAPTSATKSAMNE